MSGVHPTTMVLGVGGFAHAVATLLRGPAGEVATYLTRDSGHHGPGLAGPTYSRHDHPSPCPLIRMLGVDLVVPMSIDWAQAPWAGELLASRTPIASPSGPGMLIERDRDFARRLCHELGIPVATAHLAANRREALAILDRVPAAYVIKNPLCSPSSPVHTIVCETAAETKSWLGRIDDAEGVFLQEYLGRAEVGHLALISAGEIHSVATNQEYKRAHDGNQGIVAGTPLGGIVEQDPDDRYGLARTLLWPLRPWFQAVGYHGPIQVTAVQRNGVWHVIEYNVRLGVTCTPMVLRLLDQPARLLADVAADRAIEVVFQRPVASACSVTLCGYGYPYTAVTGPPVPVEVTSPLDQGCDVWWNDVALDADQRLVTAGHRIADVVACGATVDAAVARAYTTIAKIRTLGGYHRTDVGKSLWPPGCV